MTEIVYAEIGALFRNARHELHVPVEQAARELHIRAHYLNAIEDGRFAELPGLSYTKGYLQRYATYLQLDKEEVIRRFEQMEGVLARKGFYLPEVFSREQKPSHHLAYGGIAAAVLVYLLWATMLSPEHKAISAVDIVQQEAQKPVPDAPMPKDAACFGAQDSLYPPCYKKGAMMSDVLPQKRQVISVMELAN